MRYLQVAFTRDQHRANAARCRYEERRLRALNGTLDQRTAEAARQWRESAQEYDEMAMFLDGVLAKEARAERAQRGAA